MLSHPKTQSHIRNPAKDFSRDVGWECPRTLVPLWLLYPVVSLALSSSQIDFINEIYQSYYLSTKLQYRRKMFRAKKTFSGPVVMGEESIMVRTGRYGIMLSRVTINKVLNSLIFCFCLQVVP